MAFEDQDQQAQENAQAERMAKYRNAFKDGTLQLLVQAMKDARDEKDAQEALLAEINAKYDVLRFELIPEKMDEEGIERVTYDGIGRVSLTADMRIKTINPFELVKWLHRRKFSDLIKPTINGSTLKAFLSRRIKAGKDIPPETIVKVTPLTRASITKA